MKRRVFEKLFNSVCPEYKIINYRLLDKYEMSDDGEFYEVTPTTDIDLMFKSGERRDINEVIRDMERFTGSNIIFFVMN
jgi:hypothetical protein